MNSSRRWLIIFGIVIAVLVVATTTLVLSTGSSKVALLPGDTPQGTVQRYLLALQDENYPQAYSYLSFSSTQPVNSENDWLHSLTPSPSPSQPVWKATLGDSKQNGNNANVNVTIDVFHPGGLFGGSQFSQQIVFQLIKVNNTWAITSPTYVFWIY